MRKTFLKRLTTAAVAVATVASLFAGMSLTTSAAIDTWPTSLGAGSPAIDLTAVKAGSDTALTGIEATTSAFASGVIDVPNTAALAIGDKIVIDVTLTPSAAEQFVTGLSAKEVYDNAGTWTEKTDANKNFGAATGTFTIAPKKGTDKYTLTGLKAGAQSFTITFTAAKTVAATGHTFIQIAATEGNVFEVKYDAVAKDASLTLESEFTYPDDKFASTFTETEVKSDGSPIGADTKFTVGGNYVAPTTAQVRIADLKTGKSTFTNTFKATNAITDDDSIINNSRSLFVKIETAPDAGTVSASTGTWAFWPGTGITNRYSIGIGKAVDPTVDAPVGSIEINYTVNANKDAKYNHTDIWVPDGYTLPSVTIGKVTNTTRTNVGTANLSSDYSTVTVSENNKEVTINGKKYKVTFVRTADDFPYINATLLTNASWKAKAAYKFVLTVGGKDYTLDKDTNYSSIITTDADGKTTIDFQKVSTLTGNAVLTVSGGYLYSAQSFTLSASDLKDAKAFISLTYFNNIAKTIYFKADAAAVTASAKSFDTETAFQTDTKTLESTKKRVTVLIAGAASTTYPVSNVLVNGMLTTTINLVNDTLPAKTQVKLESNYIAGGSKTFDIKFYDQVFPVELTDGGYTYYSVVIKSIKNDILPVSKFDFIGAASSNINLIPLTTWNQANVNLNKTLFIDYTGVLTDRTTTSGVLADGTTDKIFPSTSYYQPNASYKDAYDFYARWTLDGTLYGTSVKFTRPYVTFDVTDPASKLVYSYNAVFINSKQDIYATASNNLLGGQVDVKVDTGEYSQKWKQADTYTQFAKDGDPTKTRGKINLTSYYFGGHDLASDYITLTLRLPKGCAISLVGDTNDISKLEVIQNYAGTVGNTTTDGLVDYVVRLTYRDITESGVGTSAASRIKVAYPLTNKDNKSSDNAFKEYDVVTTWVAKAYVGEKKVTMAGVTVPDPIVAPSVASSTAPTSTATSTAASSSKSSTLPENPYTGVPFNALAYIVTIGASAIGGISTMIIRKK